MKALCLAGGGAHGVIGLGAYCAYIEQNNDYNGLFGTSVGALNGCLIQQGELDELINLWKTIKNSTIYHWNPLNMFGTNASLASSTPLKQLIDHYVDITKLQINPRKFYVTASCVNTGRSETKVLPIDNTQQWILASASAPLAFPIQTINGLQYTDGGPTSNYNVQVAIQNGYDEIVLICPSNMKRKPIKNFLDMLEFQMSIQGATQYVDETGLINLLNKSKHTVSLNVYAPNEPLDFGMLDFDKASKNYDKYFQIGYNMVGKPVAQFRRTLQSGQSKWMIYK